MIYPKQAQSTAAVAAHYDELDSFYREVWGEHVHHGYWKSGRETPEEAADALVELLAQRLELSAGQSLCDIGCGYGKTAEALAERHDVSVTGLTVSAVQAARAAARRPARGALTFLVRDWLANGLPDASFERAYSVESSEHMGDKQRFFDEAFRTLRPGGRLVVCAWLACDAPRPWQVELLLEPICREGRLPSLGDEADYRALAARSGFAVSAFEDISRNVRRTWWICIRRGLARIAGDARYRRFLFDRSAANRVFALTLPRLWAAYATGSMRYCVFVFEKGG
jgi:tocopherol O-methyltransferase